MVVVGHPPERGKWGIQLKQDRPTAPQSKDRWCSVFCVLVLCRVLLGRAWTRLDASWLELVVSSDEGRVHYCIAFNPAAHTILGTASFSRADSVALAASTAGNTAPLHCFACPAGMGEGPMFGSPTLCRRYGYLPTYLPYPVCPSIVQIGCSLGIITVWIPTLDSCNNKVGPADNLGNTVTVTVDLRGPSIPPPSSSPIPCLLPTELPARCAYLGPAPVHSISEKKRQGTYIPKVPVAAERPA